MVVRHADADAQLPVVVLLHLDIFLAVDADILDEVIVAGDLDRAPGDQTVVQAFRDVALRDRLGLHVPAVEADTDQIENPEEIRRNRVAVGIRAPGGDEHGIGESASR